jgi:hypothetical protein
VDLIRGDCGNICGIEDGTAAQLEKAQLDQIKWHFERDMIAALTRGEGGGRRSGTMLGFEVTRAIGVVAAGYPDASEDSIKAAYREYRAYVRWFRS